MTKKQWNLSLYAKPHWGENKSAFYDVESVAGWKKNNIHISVACFYGIQGKYKGMKSFGFQKKNTPKTLGD